MYLIEEMIVNVRKMKSEELKHFEMTVHNSLLESNSKRVLLDEVDKRFSQLKYCDADVEMSELRDGEILGYE